MTKMRLLVVGANGGLGRQVVTHSLERGHQVTALVRRNVRSQMPRAAAACTRTAVQSSPTSPTPWTWRNV
ncbi:NAD(P)H-binding protein [Streptomyces solisilvae]|uniref:NAD(P)H-binding protein n=1 Tax=Streptomyces malaysiensis TaxID=92644 RepID=UPI00369C40ED